MKTKTLLPSLLLACAAGVAAQAYASEEEAYTLPPEACASLRDELDAVQAHLREARADRASLPEASALHEKLALELHTHLEALQTRLPVAPTQRAQASLLLSDMRDALVLIGSASHGDARQLAMHRVEDDHRLYNVLLKSLGCATRRPTVL